MFEGPCRPCRMSFLVAALLLVASTAHAQYRDVSYSVAERPKLRVLVGGGISLPVSFELGSYGLGGGVSLGLEWPQSANHSLLVRLDYDHFGQNVGGNTPAPGTEAGSANLTLLHGDVRFVRDVGTRPLMSYFEGGLGLAYRSLSDATSYDETTSTYVRRSDRGVSPAFVIASGTSYEPEEAGLGFFIDLQMVFLMGDESISYFPVRVGVTFP